VIAAQLYGREDLRLEDVPEPVPGEGEVKVAVAHNGICGSDLHEYFGGPRACSTKPHVLTGATLPQILGHEFSGVVAAVGPGVNEVSVGDAVCVEPLYSCHECDACRVGLTQLCYKLGCHGLSAHGGGLSQWTVVRSSMLHRLPASLSLAQGALVEPMSVAFNAVLRSCVQPGQSALVLGAGPIGIGVMLGFRAVGVDDLLVVEPAPARRAAVEAMGVEHVIDPGSDDVAEFVRRRTGGRGVDVAVDCAGTAATFAVAPAVLARHGRFVTLAATWIEVPFMPFVLARGGELEFTGSLSYQPGVFDRVIELMAGGAYPTQAWVEHIQFAELIDALEDLRGGRRMKLLVDIPSA
jgi:(R,R)-butanediol dehydrogenase/meso-butanediol dehydrogenase/diacetyl reductase